MNTLDRLLRLSFLDVNQYGIVTKSCFKYKANSSELVNHIAPEIIRINSLRLA